MFKEATVNGGLNFYEVRIVRSSGYRARPPASTQRFRPQVRLSCGFSEPNLKTVPPPRVVLPCSSWSPTQNTVLRCTSKHCLRKQTPPRLSDRTVISGYGLLAHA